MAEKPNPTNDPNEKEFDLDAPNEPLAGGSSPSRGSGDALELTPLPPPPEIEGGATQKGMSWKGFEEEEEYEPEMEFPKASLSDAEMDMTPMVDVTFLLLIFFMVTASFASQHANEPPPNLDERPSSQPVEVFEDQNDYVEVIIDQNNTYRITSRDLEEIEAPSDIQLRAELKNAKDVLDARKLLITAARNAWHERVVRVMDYGRTLGFDEIQAKTTIQEY